MGINADGPLPCDTSFITAYKNGNHDCIVGMYHDALQSGLKAFGFDRGVTVQGGFLSLLQLLPMVQHLILLVKIKQI